MGYDRFYYIKKAYPLYPGVRAPVSGGFLEDHYAYRRAKRGPLRAALDGLVGLGFKAWIPWRARKVQKRFGFGDDWRRHAARIAVDRFADPNDIALFRIEHAAELDGYMRRFEDAALNKQLNPLGWTRFCALADKLRFYRRCAERGLPHPGLIAAVGRSGVHVEADPAGRQLIAKPADGEGGSGVTMLGPVESREALEALLGDRFAGSKANWVVQPRIETHPALAAIALNALPTVRIVTILDESGVPEVVSATFRCASDPRAEVDNMKAGGLLAAVDLATGRLGLACKGYGGGDYEMHPLTGAPILGRQLPHWPESKALAIRAHAEAFRDYRLIGWDVAMTVNGPLLIEGNGKPGVLMPQRAARRGLGDTRYGQLIRHHLAEIECRR